MKKTAIYIRVSVLKEDAVSPQMQLDKAKQYCQLHNEQYEVFQDLDFSGKDTNRPAFQKMKEQIEAGFISKLVAYRLDRLSRSLKDLALFMDFLRDKDVEFYSITEHFDTSIPMGRAMLNIMGVFAQMEREVISQRVFDTKAKQIADGIRLGMAPYGYRIRVKRHSQWEAIPEEAHIVRMAFRLYSTGKYSYHSLAAYLNRTIGRKMRKRRSGQSVWGQSEYSRYGWQSWTIRSIIANRAYAGIIRAGNPRDLHARNYRPIISRALFERCAEIRQSRNPYWLNYQHSTTSDYPLKGKIYCKCGFKLYARKRRDPRRPEKQYYWCRNVRHTEKRPLVAVSIVLKDIVEYLKTCRLDPQLISDARRKLERQEDRTSQQMKLLRHLQRSYQRLQERYIDGGISKAFMEKKSREITARIEETQSAMQSYSKSRAMDSVPVIIGRLTEITSPQAAEYVCDAIGIFVEKVVWEDDHIRELKVYNIFKSFFPDSYKAEKRVSVDELAELCHDPEITVDKLRWWNRQCVLPDVGWIFGKKRYNLKSSLRRVRITKRMLPQGYALWQIGDFLDGKPLLATALPIANVVSMHANVVRRCLSRCMKPALVRGKSHIHYYELEGAKKMLLNTKASSQ